MKLHLPKNLRSALLSAALAVSASAPSFAAITPWAIENWNGYDPTSQSVTVGSSNVVDVDFLNQTWNTNWSIVVSAETASLTDALNLLGVKWETAPGAEPFEEALAEGVTLNGDVLKLSVWNGTSASTVPSVDFSSCGNNVIFVISRNGSSASNLTLRVYGSADLTNPIHTLTGNRAQNSNGNLAGVVLGGTGGYSTKTSVSFEENAGSYRITKVGYSLGSIATAGDLSAFNNILTWDGGGGNSWSDASWSKNGATGQTCTASDSVYFAKDGANVTIDTAASVAAATIGKDTTFNLSGGDLTVTNLTLEGGKTLTVDGSGELIVNTLGTYVGGSAGTVHAKNDTSVELVGTEIANTTVEGNLILGGGGRVTLSGTVTLDSVDNNLSAGENGYSLVGSGVTLTFTGTSDLTNGGQNDFNKIGLDKDSSITIAAGASLTTSAIFNSPHRDTDVNAALTVGKDGEKEGKLYLSSASYVRSLENAGTIESTAALNIYRDLTNTGKLKAQSLNINHEGNYTTSSLGGTVEVNTLLLDRGIATVTKDGKLTVNTSIQGGTIDATASDSPVIFKGTTIANTTIKGTLELTGSSSITLGGTVTLDSVVNKLAGGTNAFAYTGKTNPVTLTFTGASDLTDNLKNSASRIVLRSSTIIVGNADGTEATLTTKAIQLSGETANYNASVVVKGGGTLNLAKVGAADTEASCVNTLTNEVGGTITSEKNIYVYANVTNSGSLAASTLKIRNATPQDTKTLTSELGGTVNVDTLMLAGGTTNISGKVTAGSVSTDGTTAKTLGGTGGTLTLGSETDSTSTANVTLTGSFGIQKTGTSTQVLSGDTSGYSGKLTVSGGTLKVTNGIGNSAASAEVSGSGVLALTDTITATAKSGQLGTAKNVTINAGGITGAASGGGELSGLTLDFVAANTSAEISNVTMRDVTLKATATPGGTVTYANAKATVATVGEKESAAPTLDVATLSDTPATLTAMAVQHGGTASGTLTIDLTGKLLNEYSGRTLEWKFLDQVTLGAGFKVVLGDILAGMVSDGLPGNGLPEVWLTVGDGESTKLGTADISNITTAGGGLLAGTSGPVDVVLTVKNIPEPTTATLSLLALAALAARRRRK